MSIPTSNPFNLRRVADCDPACVRMAFMESASGIFTGPIYSSDMGLPLTRSSTWQAVHRKSNRTRVGAQDQARKTVYMKSIESLALSAYP